MAQAPFKNLLMMGFMMWMAGSTVHLFSIGITFSALWQPLSALQSVGKSTVDFSKIKYPFSKKKSHFCYSVECLHDNCFSFAVFEPYKDSKVDTMAPKLLFIALNMAAMGLGVWKVGIGHYPSI